MNRNLIRLCLGAMMGVLLTVGKEVMAFLPNFEPVTLLTVLFTLCFGGLALGAVAGFLLLGSLSGRCAPLHTCRWAGSG